VSHSIYKDLAFSLTYDHSAVRDAWDSKKPEYNAEISKIMGEAWTVDANPNLIYAYADESYKDRVGTVLTW
jgi:hypothetical protein